MYRQLCCEGFAVSNAQQQTLHCQDPQLARRFSTVQIGNVCKMRDVWVQRARARADAPQTKLTQKQFTWLNDVWQCDVHFISLLH